MIGADRLKQEIQSLEASKAQSEGQIRLHSQQVTMIEGALQVLGRLVAEADAAAAASTAEPSPKPARRRKAS